MLRKRNDFEIIEALRKGPKHIRHISEATGIIPSTVTRTMRRLEEEGAVDFIHEGKNKIYSLKQTPEGQLYLYMTEHYKLLKLLQDAQLRRIARQLQEHTSGELIMLFGSHAKGTANSKSDIDIFVETDDRALKTRLSSLSEKLGIKIGKLQKENPLTQEIIKHHVIIQNTERFYRATR
ncbi:nucleotidyltransferase domain-containing protein [Candidatus Woesearchaeota archaeon]|nr:nucleotidyltransferase domain-containing protein [Candidatus Woesearchaeota archaeon]